ncbi:MAG: aspartate aminotransferase family protein [Ectothiorhodospiraceae bacterium]|nr:aspartate aminotransferase family protein [Chromatiales bacterium]MCP5154800.1 aspartate aminotransferase family protein [Ectothiorhodospiraceae bacterium]
MKTPFPSQSTPRDVLFRELEAAREHDVDWRGGRLGIYTHFGGDDVLEVAKDASRMYFSENALGPSAFPSLKRFEEEVVAWTLDLMNGSGDSVGSITSGGTESIFLAVKTARDWARATRPHIERPVAVVPRSAHPAFNKAGHFLDVDIRRVPLGAGFRADVDAMAAAIDHDTVMLVGSAPQFAHGVFDPIESLGRLAIERDLWLHVDACVGGFIAPFVRRLGRPVPPFGFEVEGVRSISADLHKYGFTPKGASTVLFRDREARRHQVFEFDEWSRGHYASPTFAGTRPGGPIAGAWAVLRYLGEAGYVRIAGEIMGAVDRLCDGIRAIEGLELLAEPPVTILCYTSRDGLDINAVARAMTQRGWFVTRGAEPPCIHMGMLTLTHVPVVDDYLTDLAAAVADVRAGKVTATSEAVTYGA